MKKQVVITFDPDHLPISGPHGLAGAIQDFLEKWCPDWVQPEIVVQDFPITIDTLADEAWASTKVVVPGRPLEGRIQAIKHLRQKVYDVLKVSLGLKEAKDAIDAAVTRAGDWVAW